MDLSIIIVSWNTCDLLESCLKSVFDTMQGENFEVIVVDNASKDNSVEMVQRLFSKVKLIRNQENVGFARANNQALQESSGRYVLLLNSDAFLRDGCIEQMIRMMDESPDIGIAGANLISVDGQPQVSHGPLPTLYSEVRSLLGLDKLSKFIIRACSQPAVINTGMVSGACLMARRSMLNQIGLLDEQFFMFSEEIDLCLRAHEAGWRVVHIPDARVIHVGGGSTGITPKRLLLLYQGKLLYFSKHHGQIGKNQLLVAIKLTSVIKMLVYSFIRIFSLGRVQKDEIWRDVVRGLENI